MEYFFNFIAIHKKYEQRSIRNRNYHGNLMSWLIPKHSVGIF